MNSPIPVLLAALAALLMAVVSGSNDGATILALNLSGRGLRALPSLLVLMVALVSIPLISGMPIASTLVVGLVGFDDSIRPLAVASAVLLAVTVVSVLSRRGLPTSLTLALVGSLVGIGVGLGEPVRWSVVARVAGVAALAPLVAGGVAYGVGRMIGRLRLRPSGWRWSAVNIGTFVLQAIAYGSNDGQKVIAVLLASGTIVRVGGSLADTWTVVAGLVTLAIAFGAGTLLGIRATAGRLGRDVIAIRPIDALTAQAAASAAVLASAGLNAPVSMTQSSAAALVGSCLVRGAGRVRWQVASRIVSVWIATMPAALVIGVLGARLSRLVQ